MKRKFCCIAYLLLLSSGSIVKADDGADWLNDGAPQLPKGVTTNDASMVDKDASPFHLTVQAQRQMKSDHPDQAIRYAQRALELEPDSAETHQVLAEAYERKYKITGESDSELFNQAVKEWLGVLRNEWGEEKGTSFHGIALPGVGGKFYEDDDRHRPARQHLIKLTGTSPKVWETSEKFLKRVHQLQSETSVSAKLIKDGDKGAAGSGSAGTVKRSSATPASQPH